MSSPPETAVPTRRKKKAQGKERTDTTLGHASTNTSRPEEVKEGSKLPSGWKWKTIPDLITDEGVFIDGDWVESKDQDPNGDVRLIQLADVGDGVYRNKSDRFMTKAKADELRCTFLKDGDVLIARMPDPLGRACIFPGDAKPSVTVVDVAIVRSGNGEFDHRWLACFVNAHPFRSAISGLQAGSTRKRISRGNLATIPLPVPPLPEQLRIVGEIEKQFTRLEAGVAALRRVQANLKRYRAAVLKAACEGRLVPTESELAKTGNRKVKCESGEALLARILDERRKNWQGRGQYKEPAMSDAANLPLIPEGWTWASAGQLLRAPLCNGVSVKGSDNPPGVRALRLSAMSSSGFDYFDVRYLPLPASDVDDLWIQEGDFFMSRGNGSLHLVGRGTSAQKPPNPIIFPDTMIRLRLADPVRTSGWVRTLWPSRLIRSQIEAKVKTTAGIYKIAQPQVERLAIPLPPLAEQMRIVAEVDRRLSVVDELEAVVSANLQRAIRLRQAILTRAFAPARDQATIAP